VISSIHGKISRIDEGSLVVEVGGVGLLIYVPGPLTDELTPGESIFLHTYLIVRQDALALYGFDSLEGREYFALLLGVSGIGPRLAVTILSTLTPDSIRRAVVTEQAEIFSRVPGVGKKTAQKIVFSLQDKISKEEGFEPIAAMSEADSEVLSALIALGYSVVEAQAALQSIPRDAPQDVEERLRLALMYFS
jgi:Holliday junction DNA helicase RuvA